MEVKLLDFQAPVITVNYEEIKAELQNNLIDYKGLVVTEETLDGAKAAKKELSKVKKDIDKYRVEKKKAAEEPIKHFESQCKELISMIEEVEKPIKDGIQVFTDRKKEEKRKIAEELRLQVIEETGLHGEFAEKLVLIDKYSNVNATKSGVLDDLKIRAMSLVLEQSRQEEKIETICKHIDVENEKLLTKMSIQDFKYVLDKPLQDVLEEITRRSRVIYEAENRKEATQEPQQTPPDAQETPVINNEYNGTYRATYVITGTIEQLRSVSRFLKSNNIEYQVTDQREV